MDLLKYLSNEFSRWESIEQQTQDDSSDEDKEPATVQLLHRSFYSLYGKYPKMEERFYSICKICEQVFNPQAIAKHREHCLGKDKNQMPKFSKKIKSKKKTLSSLPFPPLFKEEDTTAPSTPKPEIPQSSRTNDTETIPISIPIATCSKSDQNDSNDSPFLRPSTPLPKLDKIYDPSIRNKKKSSKSKYNPNIHCGVIDGQKGPCTRSITCSNHKIQLRKSVPGRSKDIHQLIAEKKKEKDRIPLSLPQLSPRVIETKSTFFQIIEDDTTASEVQQTAEISKATRYSDPFSLANITANNIQEEVDESIRQLENGYCIPLFNSENDEEDSLLTYLLKPVNPPIIQKENTIYVKVTPNVEDTPSNAITKLLIPDDKLISKRVYKSHPKPHSHPIFGARKIGGSIICSNNRLEYQRNDIQLAINKRRLTSSTNCKNSTLNNSNRSILIKRNINKVNCKRLSTDKLNTGDSKQLALSHEMNGFIIQTDMSEIVADAPPSQPNYCIQENINLLNMK